MNYIFFNHTSIGLVIKENSQEKIYQSLKEILTYYAALLKTPFDSPLPKEPFFFGDLSAEQAQEYLKGKKPGTFLIRFSR